VPSHFGLYPVWVLLLGVGDDSTCFSVLSLDWNSSIRVLLSEDDRMRYGRLAVHFYQFIHHILLFVPFSPNLVCLVNIFAINLSLGIWQLSLLNENKSNLCCLLSNHVLFKEVSFALLLVLNFCLCMFPWWLLNRLEL